MYVRRFSISARTGLIGGGAMSKNVKVYSTPTCPYCLKAKQFLRDNNVTFEDIDVSSNPDKAQEMVNKSGQMGVPTLDVEGEIIVGFDKDALQKALNLA